MPAPRLVPAPARPSVPLFAPAPAPGPVPGQARAGARAGSVAAAASDLLAGCGPDGRWHGGCRGRLIESALTAHLLRATGRAPAARRAVERFCARELAAQPAAHRDPFDSLLSGYLAAAALRRPARPGDAARLRAALTGHEPVAGPRKRALIAALLRLLRPEESWEVPPLPPDPLAAGGGGWLRPTLAAVRLLAGPQDPGAVRAALALLRESQSCDGGWDQYVLGTVTILLVLHTRGLAPDLVDRGLRFVVSQVREDGGVPFISGLDLWLTSLASLTLAESGVGGRRLAASAAFLCEAQLPDGGWGYAPGVTHADTDDTAVTVSFLRRCAGTAARDAADAGVAWLHTAQNADGGFNTYAGGARSEVEITAKAVLALLAGRPGPAERTAAARGWDWLAARQRPDGGYPYEWTRSAAFPVLHVVRAARAVARHGLADPARVVAGAVARAARGLRAAAPDPLGTAYAVGALAAAGRAADPAALARGVRLLAATGPGTEVPPDALGPRPFVYDVPLLYAIYRLGGLAAARVPAAGRRRAGPASRGGARGTDGWSSGGGKRRSTWQPCHSAI
ncbi:prenyltransferase/squalene oxidase repeat-containing protein [Streptomyces marincola]|uniref:prenyltransferase/squalene oxidase repeat-containing protein n=1 Tax=Streptomyces marincola TaxID=2878388 RepID=UPI000D1A6B12|nr:prenyltransferase/squalene oxidase repeat-containing protein [Streptomyces marincola]